MRPDAALPVQSNAVASCSLSRVHRAATDYIGFLRAVSRLYPTSESRWQFFAACCGSTAHAHAETASQPVVPEHTGGVQAYSVHDGKTIVPAARDKKTSVAMRPQMTAMTVAIALCAVNSPCLGAHQLATAGAHGLRLSRAGWNFGKASVILRSACSHFAIDSPASRSVQYCLPLR